MSPSSIYENTASDDTLLQPNNLKKSNKRRRKETQEDSDLVEKQERKRKKREQIADLSERPQDILTDTKKRKKRREEHPASDNPQDESTRRKNATGSHIGEPPTITPSEDARPHIPRKSKKRNDDNDERGDSGAGSKTSVILTDTQKANAKKRRKHQKEHRSSDTSQPKPAEVERPHLEDFPPTTSARDAGDDEQRSNSKPKSHAKHNRTKKSNGFPDPNDDDDISLSDQSKKVLAYVYFKHMEPNTWKFNKARQNWLLRNLWSPQAIPDKYLTLVIRYLSGVQGRVRETLIETCKHILDSPTPEGIRPAAQETSHNPKEDPPDKQQRARLLLDALTANI